MPAGPRCLPLKPFSGIGQDRGSAEAAGNGKKDNEKGLAQSRRVPVGGLSKIATAVSVYKCAECAPDGGDHGRQQERLL